LLLLKKIKAWKGKVLTLEEIHLLYRLWASLSDSLKTFQSLCERQGSFLLQEIGEEVEAFRARIEDVFEQVFREKSKEK